MFKVYINTATSSCKKWSARHHEWKQQMHCHPCCQQQLFPRILEDSPSCPGIAHGGIHRNYAERSRLALHLTRAGR